MDVEIDGEDLFDVEVLVDKLLIKEELQLQLTSASAESWWHELIIHPEKEGEGGGDVNDEYANNGDDDDDYALTTQG